MNESLTYGLDFRGGEYLSVCVDNTQERPVIASLNNSDTVPNMNEIDSSRLVLSVPDGEVIVKYIKIPGEIPVDIETAIRFELSQATLDDNTALAFDYLTSHDANNFLGFIYRRKKLESLAGKFGLNVSAENGIKCDFRTRAVALAKGYLAFCRRAEGDLVCLADINDNQVSIAFIFRQAIVDLASLKLPPDDLRSLEKTAIDFKTLVNFKLAALAGRGISQPPSALIVANDNPDKSISTALARYFPVGITRPVFIEEYLPEAYRQAETSPEKYLVTLGLTVN